MLDLHNILWVIPGFIFIYFYNKFRPDNPTVATIELSGWPYLFFLVVIASLTWFPAELIVDLYNNDSLIKEAITLLVSILFTAILLALTQWDKIAQWIFLPVQDNFYKKCLEWENSFILVTLKNEKAYIGILWKYPESPKSRHESQTISIIPFKSGYRDEKTKEVRWNINYPEYNNQSQFISMEIIIPRTEIVTFGKFNRESFKYFYNDKNSELGSKPQSVGQCSPL